MAKTYLRFSTTEEYLAFKKSGKKFVEPERVEEAKEEKPKKKTKKK